MRVDGLCLLLEHLLRSDTLGDIDCAIGLIDSIYLCWGHLITGIA